MLMPFYFLALAFWALIWASTSLLSLVLHFDPLSPPSLNPLHWNSWLLTPTAILAGLAAINAAESAAQESRRVNANLYFSWRPSPSVRPDPYVVSDGVRTAPQVLPLTCLTVTAELLDEVLLGFSSEPIVFGVLAPKLSDLFRPKFLLRLPPVPLGYEPRIMERVGSRFSVFRQFIFSAVLWAAAPLLRLWRKRMTNNLLRLISAAAFGIPLHETTDAVIVASSKIDEPSIFQEHLWDVPRTRLKIV